MLLLTNVYISCRDIKTIFHQGSKIAPSRPGERFLFPRKDSDVILPVKYLLELCRLCVKKISLLEETLFQQGSEFNPTIILENI